MMLKSAKTNPVINPNVPHRRMLLPAYTAISPMSKSMKPQRMRLGINSSISRRLSTQVLRANSDIASKT
jgi:hypothetical protein